MATDDCPCGGGSYDECCGPAHEGTPAATPEELMRSRYSAFALRDEAYLLRTWHPTTRPGTVDLPTGRRWTRLRILAADGDTVAFRAHFRDSGEPGVLTERSRFEKLDGEWLYVDGDVG